MIPPLLPLALLVLVATPLPIRPGPQGGGVTLLPNGWRIAPAGVHLPVGDLPLALARHPDGRHLAILSAGYSPPSVRLVDLTTRQVVERLPLENAWGGLAWSKNGDRLFVSGGGANSVFELPFRDGRLAQGRKLDLGIEKGFAGGLGLSPDGSILYVALVHGEGVQALDTATGAVLGRASLGAEAYAVTADNDAVYVSVWGAARVVVLAPRMLTPVAEITLGEHPSALALSPDGTRLFVACSGTNEVFVVDVKARRVDERLGVALTPRAPPGSTPDALAVSADGKTLLVATADNNAVAVLDISRPGQGRFLGLVPTGWYPTGVDFDEKRAELLVLSGKGVSSAANPRGPNPNVPRGSDQYIGSLLGGTLSFVPWPDEATLASMTARARALSPVSGGALRGAPVRPRNSPIPSAPGGTTPIRHVVYVIRENRTYDQVLGDLPTGNGDPNLTLFGEEVTPNAHALAREFVLFDNFYVNADVSADGHAFSTAAYANDAVTKLWPTFYAGRGSRFFFEGGPPFRNAYGNLGAPPAGYLWDFAARARVSVRSYGEFAFRDPVDGTVRATVPGLESKVNPTYPPWDLSVPDGKRIEVFVEELSRFERDGGFPSLSIVRLPNDHTAGTRPGMPTPRVMVAENDLALGRLVEALSKSRFWRDTAVFVVEDDAQDGPDHVDAHRSVLLVASPYARHGALDSSLYSTASVLRTIELILGLPPMSQYDASATPLFGAFASQADARAYPSRPARIDLSETNGSDAPGAKASQRMDFGEADRAPDRELNEIVWQSVRGLGSTMPAPVRAAFVPRPGSASDDD